MGWVRVSDDFYDHDKFATLSVLGDAVWIRGLAYANRNLTDGFITERAARGLVDTHGLGIYTSGMTGRDAEPQDGIDELLAADIWHAPGHSCPECPQPGPRTYVMHDYLDYQPSREEVEAKRDEGKERVRKHRERRRNSVTPPVTNAVSTPVSNPVSTDRPNPNPNPKNPSKTSIRPSGSVGGVGDGTDEVMHRARLFGFDPVRIRQELVKLLGESPDDDQVMHVATEILGRASRVPKNPTAYIIGSLRKHPEEGQQLAYGGAA